MHELGTVFYVIQEVEKVVEENHLTQVASVTLEVGEVSGIIPYYLTDCWKGANDLCSFSESVQQQFQRECRTQGVSVRGNVREQRETLPIGYKLSDIGELRPMFSLHFGCFPYLLPHCSDSRQAERARFAVC